MTTSSEELAALERRSGNLRADPRPAIGRLAEIVSDALALAATDDAAVSDAVGAALRELEVISPHVRRRSLEDVHARLAAFRHSSSDWAVACADLPPLHSPPVSVQELVESYLEQLATLRCSHESARRLGEQATWIEPLARSLETAFIDALARLGEPAIRPRLWVLRRRAGALRLDEALPSLVDVLVGRQEGAPTRTLASPEGEHPGTARIERAARELDGRDDAIVMARDLMQAVLQDSLCADDLALARSLVALRPGIWAVGHRERLQRGRFAAPCPLVVIEGDVWTAPAPLRVAATEVSGTALPSGANGVLHLKHDALDTPGPYHETSVRPAAGALVHRELTLATLELLVFGDDFGFWLRGARGDEAVKVRCEATPARASGAVAQFPLLYAGAGTGSQATPFRAGPLRPILAAGGKNADRAYSPRAYLVSVGESSLRNLLGWSLGEPSRRLHEAARSAGVRDGHDLLDRFRATDPLEIPWVRQLAHAKAPCILADQLAVLSELAAAEVAAEADTIVGLAGDLCPVDGDLFMLLSTETATSILAAWLLERYLAARFPSSRIAKHTCQAMVQAADLGAARYDVPDQSLAAAYRAGRAVAEHLLVEEGADPVLVISGGTKWESAALLELGADRRLACVYKFQDSAAPVAFRWDRIDPITPATAVFLDEAVLRTDAVRAGPAPVRGHARHSAADPTHWLVLNVGISLLSRFRREQGDARARPDFRELLGWARARDESWRLCAELTGMEAWRLTRAPAAMPDALNVALIRTRPRAATSYAEGRVCGEVIEALLEERGMHVRSWAEWDVIDLANVQDPDPRRGTSAIFAGTVKPIQSCIAAIVRAGVRPKGTRPDVVFTGGQKLTAALLHLVARSLGCPTYLAAEPGDGESPHLSLVHAGGTDDPRLVEPGVTLVPVADDGG